MTVERAPERQSADVRVREVYEEYVLEATRVATISDPQNPRAWVQSDWTMPIEA